MSLAQSAAAQLAAIQEYFHRSTRNLTEEHSTFAPAEGMMTAAQQVAHTAQTVDWFVEGAFRPEGFDMDFTRQAQIVAAVTSLAEARAWFDRAVANATAVLSSKTDEELLTPLPEGIMGGHPRFAIVSALVDHTAHHRGALTVYARLNGLVPPMPYMEM